MYNKNFETMNSNNRLVFNTIVVYGQLVITMIISLLSVRYILQALGEENYGIYAIVGGVVAMLNVFTTALSQASMRFMAHSLGKGDKDLSLKTFNTSLLVHCLFGIFLILVLEIGGWIMFEYFLDIPIERIEAAKIVYQFMVVTTFLGLLNAPFDAIINAHENLLFLSLVTIGDSVLRLLNALYLLFFCSGDKLVSYGLLALGSFLLQLIIKQLYTRIKYEECHVDLKASKDKTLIKEFVSFFGWNFLPTAASILSSQLRNIFVNMFFGVRVNAGQGIATNVNGYVNQLSVGITQSITPQMNKSEGEGNRARLIKLTKTGVKYTSFMFVLVSVPIMLEIPFIYKVWLGTIPTYAIIFTRLVMIEQILSKLTWQLGNAIKSVGNIRACSIMESFLLIVFVFVMYIFMAMGFDAEWIYIVGIVCTCITGLGRMVIAKKIVGIEPWDYVKTTIFPLFLPMILPLILSFMAHFLILNDWIRLITVFSVFIISYFISFLFMGIPKDERESLNNVVKSFTAKLRH